VSGEQLSITATMDDIAQETGLSKMTVSRALSNKGYVSERSRKLILAAAKKLDYQVNMLARQLSSNRTYLLGVITPFGGLLGTFYFGQVLRGVQQALSGTGYHAALFDSQSEDFNDGSKCANLCRQRRVDGLIVVAPVRNDRFPLTFANLEMPLVVVGSSFRQMSISYVDVDNFGAAAAMTEYLARLGHKKIGFLLGPPDLHDAAERELAFRKTLAAHHLPITEKWILQGDYETRKAFHLALELLSKENRPTAIFAANDLMAYGVLDAARMLKLSVPEDLSVAGFDDLDGSAESIPSLTTAAQPMEQLGRVAASYLLGRLNGYDAPSTLHQKLSAQLVIRGSTAPPPCRPRSVGLDQSITGVEDESRLN
jgi:DNA-binding LacI/PurR family transcriptional regulator